VAVRKTDWIARGLLAFRAGGVDAVSVERLARELGVTKGSFYWHFKDRDALLHELLALWRDETRQLIAAARRARTPRNRVLRFFAEVARTRGQLPDLEFFAWARRSKAVARFATAVEQERIGFLWEQLRAGGLPGREAAFRAEAAYLTTLGWIERAERTPEQGTPAELRRFTTRYFGWLFRNLLLVAMVLLPGCASGGTALRDSTPGVAATAVLPETPSGAALAAWLEAYNTGNLDSLRAVVERAFDTAALAQRPALARAESDRWLFLNLGPMRVLAIDSVSDTTVSAVVYQSLVEGWGHVTLRVNAAPPHGVLARSVSFFELPPATVPRRRLRNDGALTAELEAFAGRLARAGVFSGVVGMSHGGRSILEHAYGFAQRERNLPNAVETRFALASVTKMFTSVAIAQLVQQGKLSYYDTVARVLPDYPNRATAGRLTVAHLLTHSSGLPEYLFNPAYRALPDPPAALREFWPFFALDSLRFAPGSQWEYSSSNYIVLGAIVEQAAGQPFSDYLAEHIFKSARMTSTFTPSEAARRATPYTRFGPERRPDLNADHPVESDLDARRSPAGGGLSTVPDLLRFGNALLEHRLLDAATLDTATAPRIPTEDASWSFGFEVQSWNGVSFFGHNGFAGGTFNQVDVFPTRGYVVAVLSNTDMSGAGALAYRARLLLTAP
jgi:D-alanyl-D-alanine carboxypeptidase